MIDMHPLHLNRQPGQAVNRSTSDMHKDHPTVWSDVTNRQKYVAPVSLQIAKCQAVIQTVRYTHRQAGRPTA